MTNLSRQVCGYENNKNNDVNVYIILYYMDGCECQWYVWASKNMDWGGVIFAENVSEM